MNTLNKEEKCSCGCGHSHHEHHQVYDCCTEQKQERRAVKHMLTKKKCSCGCDCGDEEEEHNHEHSHDNEDGNGRFRLILLGVGAVIYVAALFVPEESVFSLPMFIAAYLLLGFDVVATAVMNIRRGEVFDENFLMSISTIGAFALGEYHEAVAVMLFYQIGERLQDMAAGRSRRSIRQLIDIKAESAHVVTPEGIETVAPEKVKPGQIVLVKPGERFPLDGVLTEGSTQADTSPLTGEFVPRVLSAGDTVLSGSINLTGAVQVRITNDYSNSTVAKVMEMVEKAQARKAPAERFMKRFAKVYTPVVVCAAVLLAVVPPLVLQDAAWADWIKRALVFLVVSCPCALVVSVPLSFFSGIGASSKKGILVKGGNYIQALSEVDTVVFDKTGTLTKGVFAVTKQLPAAGISEETLLETAVLMERLSNHPIAKSICTAYEAQAESEPREWPYCDMFEEKGGFGITARFGDDIILCGNDRLMAANNVPCEAYDGIGSVVHVAKNGAYLGLLVISDVMRDGAAELVSQLRKAGIKRTVMLTGDRRENAERFANMLGISDVCAELLPDGKVNEIERLYSERKECKIVFVGDGINDAPVLSRADVGIAMGGVGSDAAVEAADVVLMTDEPLKVAEAIRTAKNTMRIVRQNVVFSLFVKFAVLALAVFGYASMWLAVFADVGVTLLAVLNAVRRK